MRVPDENAADLGADAIEHALVRVLAGWCHDRDARGPRRTLLAILLKLDEVS
jgi:hypothetical protein